MASRHRRHRPRSLVLHVATLLLLLLLLPLETRADATSLPASDASASSSGSQHNATATIAVSYCERCRDHGECDRAYMGGAGIFCGTRTSACCCPADGVCVRAPASSYECACGAKPKPAPQSQSQRASVQDQQHGESSALGGAKVAWTVLTALVLCMLIAVYLYATRADRK